MVHKTKHTRIFKEKNKNKFSHSGFTLIELLVVISIITLLSSIMLATLTTARKSARDGKRVADVQQLSKALELYYNDYNHYPTSTAGVCNTSLGDTNCITAGTNTTWTSGTGISALVNNSNLPQLPKDPSNSTNEFYLYKSCSDGQSYVLLQNQEKNYTQQLIKYGPRIGTLMADINGDGIVNAVDVGLIRNCFGVSPYACPYPTGDQNGDGVIDATDYNILRSYIGQSC